jgi:hypothetical protein
MESNKIKFLINFINYYYYNIYNTINIKDNINLFNNKEMNVNKNIIVNNNFINSNKNIVSNEEIKYCNKNTDFFENEIHCNTSGTDIIKYSVTANSVLASFTSPKKCKKSRIIASFINVFNEDIDYTRVIYTLGWEIYMKKYKWPWSQVVIISNDKEEIFTNYFDEKWGYKYKYTKISWFIKFLKEYDREYINRFLNESILFFSHVDWNTLLVLFKENNIDISGGDKSMREKLSINQYKLSISCFFLNIEKSYIAYHVIRAFHIRKRERGEKENILKYLIKTRNNLEVVNFEKKINEYKNIVVNVNKIISFNIFVSFVCNFLGKKEKSKLIICKYSTLNSEITLENVMERQKKIFINNEKDLPWLGVIIIFNEENIDTIKEKYSCYLKYNVILLDLYDFMVIINGTTQEKKNHIFKEFLFFFHNFEWNHVKNLFKINNIFISKGNKNLRYLLSINHYKLSLFLYILGIKKFKIGLNFHKK